MSITVTIQAAKTNLFELLARVEAGEEIVIVRGRMPVAKLIPVPQKATPTRRFGAMRGKARADAAFFEPLPESELKSWD